MAKKGTPWIQKPFIWIVGIFLVTLTDWLQAKITGWQLFDKSWEFLNLHYKFPIYGFVLLFFSGIGLATGFFKLREHAIENAIPNYVRWKVMNYRNVRWEWRYTSAHRINDESFNCFCTKCKYRLDLYMEDSAYSLYTQYSALKCGKCKCLVLNFKGQSWDELKSEVAKEIEHKIRTDDYPKDQT